MNKIVQERLAQAQQKIDEAKAVANQTPDENSRVATPDQPNENPSQSEDVTPDVPEVPNEGESSNEIEGVKEAAKASTEPAKATKGHFVVSPFRDKEDFTKQWNIGENVDHFDSDRLKKCIDLKLVEKK